MIGSRFLLAVLLFGALPSCIVLANRMAIIRSDARNPEFVARVDDVVITRRDVASHKSFVSRVGGDVEVGIGETKGDVLGDLIDLQIAAEWCKQSRVDLPSEVKVELEKIMKERGLASLDEFKAAAAREGQSFEDIQEMIRERVVESAAAGAVGSLVSIDVSDEQQYYKEHEAMFQQPELFHLAEIIVRSDPSDEQGRVKAQKILKSIRNGIKFEDIARQATYSQVPQEGGDLGWFKRGVLAKQLEEMVSVLRPGDVSDVIATKQGFVILKLSGYQPARTVPFAEAQPSVREALYRERLEPALDALLSGFADTYFVEVNREFHYKRVWRDSDPRTNFRLAFSCLIGSVLLVAIIQVLVSRRVARVSRG